MTHRHASLAVLAAALAAFAGAAGPARSDDPALTQVLPDMRQKLPTDVRVAQMNGVWQLGFSSEVANDGPGYLKIAGMGPGDGTMVADQNVQMSDGSVDTVQDIGQMRYVVSLGHQHWHLLDFERYELRDPNDPTNTIVRDQKTGFCLANAFTSDICGRNHPEYTTVSEGLAVGGTDKYLAYLEGQSIPIDPGTTPTGDYLLVNRVNPTGALLETDASDNASSLRLKLEWNASGQPMITITNSCTATVDCPAPPPTPPPDPQPQPGPTDQQPTTSGSGTPATDPQQVPVVTPSEFIPASAVTSMSRSMAGRLVRRAIQKSTKDVPRRLRSTCTREGRVTFVCSAQWRGPRAVRWSGRVRVWYELKAGQLSWFYDLTARRAGGKRVVKRSVRGSASNAFFSSNGILFCTRVT